jgi:hypothetical protein
MRCVEVVQSTTGIMAIFIPFTCFMSVPDILNLTMPELPDAIAATHAGEAAH